MFRLQAAAAAAAGGAGDCSSVNGDSASVGSTWLSERGEAPVLSAMQEALVAGILADMRRIIVAKRMLLKVRSSSRATL